MTQPYKSRRNFGFGKNLSFAGKQAMRHRYGDGHFSSIHTHSARWRQAVSFFATHGIKDARKLTHDMVGAYAESVASRVQTGELGLQYGQNLISSVNVVLSTMRGDNLMDVAPRELLGMRRRTRLKPVSGLDLEVVERCIGRMREAGMFRAAAVASLARYGGMRLREATLANLPRLAAELTKHGKCNVQDGTKGGRTAPRWIPSTPILQDAISNTMSILSAARTNILSSDESYIQFVRGELRSARLLLHEFGIRGYHELRVAYACERYFQLTGQLPWICGGKPLDAAQDQLARETIARELGHGRAEVASAYIGGLRRE